MFNDSKIGYIKKTWEALVLHISVTWYPVRRLPYHIQYDCASVPWYYVITENHDIDIDSVLFNITTKTAQIMWCDEIVIIVPLLKLTLNVRGPSYLGLTVSKKITSCRCPGDAILASPGHQQPWYWLCRMGKYLSYLRKDFNACVISMWRNVININICFIFPLKNLARKGSIYQYHLIPFFPCDCKTSEDRVRVDVIYR